MNPFQSSKEEEDGEVRRGPWTLEEDNLLIQYISCHGEGRWNLLAKSAGLKRTGKSCRLRWLNYLKPDIKRGNLTPQEQLLILELHSKWGNRWSKIAQHLPGRTDNEIKNYWRTRVQKQAKQLNMESNSQSFIDAIRCFYMPRLVEKIKQSSPTSTTTMEYSTLAAATSSSPFSTSTVSPFSPRKAGDNNNMNYGSKDCSISTHDESTSSITMPSFESTKLSNPLEFSAHPTMNTHYSHAFGEVAQSSKESPVLLSAGNCYYVGNSNYDCIDEMASVSAMEAFLYNHTADHSWFADEVADDTWNFDRLW